MFLQQPLLEVASAKEQAVRCFSAAIFFLNNTHTCMSLGLIVSPPPRACMHATVMRAASQHPVLTKFKVSPPV